ncbi:MAG: HRDC domain-containing protein, partial [Nitriliruptoraceae bacterium]
MSHGTPIGSRTSRSNAIDAIDIRFVDDPEQVPSALDLLDTEIIGVDVERADAHRYHRRAALVQLGVPGICVLLDGVTLDHLRPVDRFLDGTRLTILHAATNDLAPLADKHVRPDRIADTAVAAAVLGLPTGLETLLRDVLGIELDGDKERFQRADWERRPLPDDMASYAAGDVVHLPALWERLWDQLERTARVEWYRQELGEACERAFADDRSVLRVKGTGRLTPVQRVVLATLWETREHLASTHDIAPNRLLRDEVLVDLSVDPPRTVAQLVRRSPRNRDVLREHAPSLFEALERGLEAPTPTPSTTDRRRFDAIDRDVSRALRQTRSRIAADLEIEAGLLCPSRTLDAAVAADPRDADALCDAAGLRPWQRELLRAPLWESYLAALERARTEHDVAADPADDPDEQ